MPEQWIPRPSASRREGFSSWGHLGDDPDLDNLRDDPRFTELIENTIQRQWRRDREMKHQRWYLRDRDDDPVVDL